MSDIRTLLRYKAWANDLIFADVAKLPEPVLVEPQPIIFGNLLRTLNHVHAMDYVWQSHLHGTPHALTSRNPDYCGTFEAVREAQRVIDQWFIEYADELTPSKLDENVTFTFIGSTEPASMSRGNILLHVVNHGTYHRGHVASMMHKNGVMAPTTDLPVFLKTHIRR